jgi:ferredoxin
MREQFMEYAREHNLTEAEADAEWAALEADLNAIRDEEARERGETKEHWDSKGSPRCPIGHEALSEDCDNCERRCPHNGLSHLRIPLSEWDVLDGYEPLPEDSEPVSCEEWMAYEELRRHA